MPKECIIRPYGLEDIPAIVDSVMVEVPNLPNYKNITMSRERITYVLTHNLGNASNFQCWILIDKETGQLAGGSAGYCVPSILSLDLQAQDVFLFVYPAYRTLRHCLMLLVAYKEWAKARGAKLITATHTGGHRAEAFSEVMRRQGYFEAGRIWHLRLDDEYLNRV